jgi:hypothetical protein
MPTFTNITAGPLDLPGLGLHIPAGGSFDTDEDTAEGFRFQFLIWEETSTIVTPTVTPIINRDAAPVVSVPVDAAPVVTEQGVI